MMNRRLNRRWLSQWAITGAAAYLLASLFQTLGLFGVVMWAFGPTQVIQFAAETPLQTAGWLGMFFVEPTPVLDPIKDWWVWCTYIACFGAVVWRRHPETWRILRNSLGGDD